MALQKVILGKSGIEVTELCLGTLILGYLQADLTPLEGAKTVRKAMELGINFIDTAKGYKTYSHIRLGIEGFSDVVIASKSTAKTSQEMREDVETSLREMGRDTIDIFHLHLIKSLSEMREREGALDALVRCREAGLIRSIGLSAHGPDGVLAALAYDEIEVVFPVMNKKGLGIIGGTHQEMLAAVQRARKRNIGLYDMKPLAGGHFIDNIPEAIRYVRELEIFHSIAVGLKTPDEVDTMVGLFEGDSISYSRAISAGKNRADKKHLIVYDTCKRCGACTTACAQEALTLGEKKAQVNTDLCILCGYCAASCPNFVIRVI